MKEYEKVSYLDPVEIAGWPFIGTPHDYHCSYGLFMPYFGRRFDACMKEQPDSENLAELLSRPFWEGTHIINANKTPIVVSSEQLSSYLNMLKVRKPSWIHYESIEDIITDCVIAGKKELAEDIFEFMMDIKDGKYDEEMQIIDEEYELMRCGMSTYTNMVNREKYPEYDFQKKMNSIKKYYGKGCKKS